MRESETELNTDLLNISKAANLVNGTQPSPFPSPSPRPSDPWRRPLGVQYPFDVALLLHISAARRRLSDCQRSMNFP